MLTRRLALAATAALAAPAIHAQPIAGGRPVRVIVPFPPGGAVDITSRLLADKLGPVLGQPVVVENRAGAGGLIGADAITKGDRDGSVIGLLGVTVFCALPHMHSRMPFDPIKDLAPISQLTDGALLCVVNAETARHRSIG